MALAPGGARAKGHSGELECAALLTQWAREIDVQLNIERNLEQTRNGGADLNGIPGMEVEVKRVESNGINAWWEQVCRASQRTGRWPLLAHRRNRQPWRFRTYVHAAIYNPNGDGITVAIVADMELASAKAWFQSYLKQQGV